MKRKRLTISVSLVALSLLASITIAGEVEISVTRSAVIAPPDSLMGEYGPRLLLSFDLPSGLDAEDITFAQVVSIGNFPSVDNGAPITLEVYPLTSAWDSQISWSSPWRDPGGDYDREGRQIVTLYTGGERSISADVTGMVRRWVSGRGRNYGVILIPVKMSGEAWTGFSDSNGRFRSQAKLKIYY
jgi:hypothetical protein